MTPVAHGCFLFSMKTNGSFPLSARAYCPTSLSTTITPTPNHTAHTHPSDHYGLSANFEFAVHRSFMEKRGPLHWPSYVQLSSDHTHPRWRFSSHHRLKNVIVVLEYTPDMEASVQSAVHGGSGALAGLATIGLGSSVVVVGTAMVVIAEAWGAKGESARALGDAGVVCG